MRRRFGTFVLLAFTASAHAAPLIEASAIAIAKEHCAKQVATLPLAT